MNIQDSWAHTRHVASDLVDTLGDRLFNSHQKSPNHYQTEVNEELRKTGKILVSVSILALTVFLIVLVKSTGATKGSENSQAKIAEVQAGFALPSFTSSVSIEDEVEPEPAKILQINPGVYWVLFSSKDLDIVTDLVEGEAQNGVFLVYYQVIVNQESFYRVLLNKRFESKDIARKNKSLLPSLFKQGAWITSVDEEIVVWE